VLIFPDSKQGELAMRDMKAILIVDEDRGFRKVVGKMLEKEGYRIVGADDGQTAISLLLEQPFDIVISELRLPDLDGIELMKQVNRKNTDLPVIFITAYGEVDSYMTLMNMGAYDYLNKPAPEKELLRIVKTASHKL
jgi:two-component system response regulator HydG